MNIQQWQQTRYEKLFLRAYVAGDIRKASYVAKQMRRDRSKVKHMKEQDK